MWCLRRLTSKKSIDRLQITGHLLHRTAKKCPQRIKDTPAVLFCLPPCIYLRYLQTRWRSISSVFFEILIQSSTECTGRTFFNDDILGGTECVPPCTRLNVEFASQTHCSDRIPVIPTAKVTHPYNRNAYTAAVFYRFYIYRISPPICKLNGESAQWTFPDRLDDIQHAAEFH